MIQLTEAQKESINFYREKWRNIIFSTEPRDRDRATEVIKNVYKLLEHPEPKIIFFDSFYALAKDLNENFDIYKQNRGIFKNKDTIKGKIDRIFARERRKWDRELETTFAVNDRFTWDDLLRDRWGKIYEILCDEITDRAAKEIETYKDFLSIASLRIAGLYASCAWYDFCFSELNIEDNPSGKSILDLHKYCGRIFAFSEFCLIFDRPKKILLDQERYLHAEATPAIEYNDGFSAYAYQGVWLPEKYGKLPYKDWQTNWLLKEPYGELRRCLIKGIGAKKIHRELTAEQIEELQEYTFCDLREDTNIEYRSFLNKVPPEKQALINFYRDKWRKNLFSTEPIERDKVSKIVKSIYKMFGEAEPEIIFCSSPLEIYKILDKNSDRWQKDKWLNSLTYQWYSRFYELTIGRVSYFCDISPEEIDGDEVVSEKVHLYYDAIYSKISNLIDKINRIFRDNLYLSIHSDPYLSFTDFCISELKYKIDPLGKAYLELRQNCEDIFGLPKVCLIGDRPRKLSFNSQNQLHSEGSPAIEYRDGFSIYAYRGVILPEKYGKINPKKWQSEWLLSETNAELKRVLIQGIGYDKICQDLQAVVINTWREYELLRIDSNIDSEAVYLLKMTCPSTDKIHALRVPPHFNSARQAIKWINHGIDPEEFEIET